MSNVDLLESLNVYFNEYTNAYNSGQISKDEYLNLLQGLEVEKVVTGTAEELHFKEQLNVAINTAITVVSAVA
jgi:hypothetical protein